MRSKTKVIQKPVTSGNPKDFPDWSFDGSSTGQAEGNNSDCILNPVAIYPDPIRGGQDVLVMCEVLNPDSSPHATNTRAGLAALIDAAVSSFFFPLRAERSGAKKLSIAFLRAQRSEAQRSEEALYCFPSSKAEWSGSGAKKLSLVFSLRGERRSFLLFFFLDRFFSLGRCFSFPLALLSTHPFLPPFFLSPSLFSPSLLPPPAPHPQVIAEAPLYGFEQEYTMLNNAGGVYGWPQGGYPAPQGPFYCGVGSPSVYGRPLAEAHMVRAFFFLFPLSEAKRSEEVASLFLLLLLLLSLSPLSR